MATGFFGKLPLHGDFVTRGLPAGARPLVDRWLTRVLAPLARTPDAWPERGFRGLIGSGDGVLALLILPSRDTPGRAFPLAAVSAAGVAGQAGVDGWADLALPALSQASHGDLDADALIALLGLLAVAPLAGAQPALTPPLIWAEGILPLDPAALQHHLDRA